MLINKSVSWNPSELLKSPIFEPLWAFINHLPSERWPNCTDLNRLLVDRSFSFADANEKLDYELHIYRSGQIPTRSQNPHDLFNALVWLTFPRAKAMLNQLHVEHAQQSLNGRRGNVRDVLTLFDESGVIIVSRCELLAELVRQFRWQELFWQQRDALSKHFRCVVFGHSIYEKALTPYLGLTAKAVILILADEFFELSMPHQLDYLDTRLVDYLNQPNNLSSTQQLHPFPLLGMPGWYPGNDNREFYENTDYFRAGRVKA